MSSKSGIIRAATVDDMQPWTAVPDGFGPDFNEFYWSGFRGTDAQGIMVTGKGVLYTQSRAATLTLYARGSVTRVEVPWVNPTFSLNVFNINNYPEGIPSLELDVGNPDQVVYRWRLAGALVEYAMVSVGAPLWWSNNRNEDADLMKWHEEKWIGGFDEPRAVQGRISVAGGEITFDAMGIFEHAVSTDRVGVENPMMLRDSRWMWFGDRNFYGLVLESRAVNGEVLIKTGRFGRINQSVLRLDDFDLRCPMSVDAGAFHLVEGALWNVDGEVVGRVAFNPLSDTKLVHKASIGRQGMSLLQGEITNGGSASFNGVAGTERQLKPSPTNLALILLGGAVVVSLLDSY